MLKLAKSGATRVQKRVRMKSTIGMLLFLLCFNVYSSGMEDFPRQISEKLSLERLESTHLNDVEIKLQIGFLLTILANTQELKIHQMNGAHGNKVLLHKDGHKEAVFDHAGNRVNDCLNKGSYNYYHPSKYPLAHFTADMLPWLIFGNCRNDPSTREQRISAYISDVQLGFKKITAKDSNMTLPETLDFSEYGQSVAVSFYLKAVSEAGFDFNSFVQKNINNKEQQEQFFKALEKGFGIVLKKV